MSKKSKRKTNLKSAILLLLLMAVLLITSSYAWFTSNETVTVSSLQVNVKATNGLQISADGETWKSVLSKDDIVKGYDGSTNNIPTEMAPVSTTGNVATGNMDMYYGKVITDESTGNFLLTATKDTDTTGHYIVFDLFLKVDSPSDIYLTANSKVEYKGTEDKGLQNAARVAFVEEGNTAVTSNLTTIRGLKLATGTAKIWEPNNDKHSVLGAQNARDYYGVTDDPITKVPYYGIMQEITQADNISLKQTVTTSPSATHFAKVSPAWSTPQTMSAQAYGNLKAGITKIRVYMWVEGQDVDCENGASGTDIAYTIQFSTKNS